VKYRKGFSNLARAFSLAERMFSLKPVRNKQAAHAVMVATDGIVSCKYQINEIAQPLQGKCITHYSIAVTKNGIMSWKM